jgi:hypothetical protein
MSGHFYAAMKSTALPITLHQHTADVASNSTIKLRKQIYRLRTCFFVIQNQLSSVTSCEAIRYIL